VEIHFPWEMNCSFLPGSVDLPVETVFAPNRSPNRHRAILLGQIDVQIGVQIDVQIDVQIGVQIDVQIGVHEIGGHVHVHTNQFPASDDLFAGLPL